MQATPDPAEVLSTIVDSVAVALRLGYAAIELERQGAYEVAATRGRPGPAERTTIPLTYQGEKIVGSLVVEPPPGAELTPSDRRLLDDLARQAGVAVHAVRLTADLQRSRERLVSAREEERRRLRRDLHDGLGPALASIVLKLDATRSMPAENRNRVDMLLTELRSETQEAIADIRRLVYSAAQSSVSAGGVPSRNIHFLATTVVGFRVRRNLSDAFHRSVGALRQWIDIFQGFANWAGLERIFQLRQSGHQWSRPLLIGW